MLHTSWPVLLVIALLSLFVWPWQNERSALLKDQFERRSDLSRVAPGQFQTSADGQRTFFFEGGASDPASGRNVFIVASRGDVESVVSARSGAIQNDADESRPDSEQGSAQRAEREQRRQDAVARFETYSAQAGERALDAAGAMLPRALPTVTLLREPTPLNRGELVWRVGLVLAAANMLLLGIGMSASNPRHASNWNLLFALLAFFAYYNLINLSQAWVGSGRLGVGVALGVGHGGVLVLALALLWWRENGMRRVAVTAPPPPRRASPRHAA